MTPSLLLLLALGATSKLGPVIYSDTGGGVATVLASCPQVVRWVLSSSVAAQTVNSFPSQCGIGVQRIVAVSQRCGDHGLGDVPEQAADECWNAVLPEAGMVTPNGVWLEGFFGSSIPDWNDGGAPVWLAKFWARLADRMNEQGFNPLLPAYSVTEASQLKPLVAEMKKRSYTWGWSASAFSNALSTDVCRELDGALAFRALRDAAGLQGKPLFLSEAGLGAPGWQRRGTTAEEYLDWLRWFDARLQEDSEVQGAALFQLGDNATFADFDLAPLAEQLAAHVELAAIPAVPQGDTDCAGTPDAGIDAGSSPGNDPGPGSWQAHDPDEAGCGCQSTAATSLGVPLLVAAAGLLLRRAQRSRED